jgi:hypothetical protein
MAVVGLKKYFPSVVAYKYMLANIRTKKNENNRPGEANTAPSSLRMAFSHTLPIGK